MVPLCALSVAQLPSCIRYRNFKEHLYSTAATYSVSMHRLLVAQHILVMSLLSVVAIWGSLGTFVSPFSLVWHLNSKRVHPLLLLAAERYSEHSPTWLTVTRSTKYTREESIKHPVCWVLEITCQEFKCLSTINAQLIRPASFEVCFEIALEWVLMINMFDTSKWSDKVSSKLLWNLQSQVTLAAQLLHT